MNLRYNISERKQSYFVSKILLLSFLCVLYTAANALKAQATLTTDHPDYAPGSTVNITGTGFQPGETVQLQVTHDMSSGDNNSSTAHEPWAVNADENGDFATSWLVPPDQDELNSSLVATADGQLSLLHAEVSFTDANWTIGPSYTDLCGGFERELIFTITQTDNLSFQNSRFRIVFPGTATISSASIVSVSASKNWTLSVTGGNDICLRAVNQVTDALSSGQSITFKILATPPNTLGQVAINGVSAAAGSGCPTTGTTATLPLKILRVSSLSPVFTLCPSGISANTDPGECSAIINYTSEATGTDLVVTHTFSGATTGSGGGTGSGSVFGKGVTHVIITASNNCATKTCSFDVTISDAEKPVINCPENIHLRSCDKTASWSVPIATDNCTGVTVEQTGGPAPGSEFAKGSTTSITYTATDASGNTSSCTFEVTRTDAEDISVNVNDYNKQLYFGYSGDQSSTLIFTASGGVGPYAIKTEMSRPLICNYINDAGDETWSSTASTFNNLCSLSPSLPPYSQINPGNPLTVKVTLLNDAVFTTTVKDNEGCEVSRTDAISAEDARCFAGVSGVTKVTLCHKTGSAKNPCITLCVDEDAVPDHLAHGDVLGKCTPGCSGTALNAAIASSPTIDATKPADKPLSIKIANNPNAGGAEFLLTIESKSNEKVIIRVSNMNGIKVFTTTGNPSQAYRFGSGFSHGMYVVEVVQGKEIKRLKVIKAN